MDSKQHWESVYQSKAPTAVSWYTPHLERSLQYIERAAPDRGASIIDVGGGESTLVDDLLEAGYTDVTVLDISPKALEVARELHRTPAGGEQQFVYCFCKRSDA